MRLGLGLDVGLSAVIGCGSGDPASWQLVPSGIKAAWRTDMGLSYSAGVSVTWTDQVGGTTLAQSTGSQVPGYTASNAGFNNRPTLDFNTSGASDDNVASDQAASFWNFLHDGTGATVLIVMRAVSGGATGTTCSVISTRGLGVASRGFIIKYNTTNLAHTLAISDGTADVISAVGANNSYLQDVTRAVAVTHTTADTPDATLYYPPGTSQATGSGTPSVADAAATLRIGSVATSPTTQEMSMSLAEVAFWTRTLTAGEISTLLSYVTSYYGAS